MVENTIYLATREVAERAGVYETAYMVADGRLVIDSMDIRRIRLTGDEYINGITGIERITEQEAELMISENGYRRSGDYAPEEAQQTAPAETPAEGGLREDAPAPAADEGGSDSGSSDSGSSDEGSGGEDSGDEGSSSGDTETNQEEE